MPTIMVLSVSVSRQVPRAVASGRCACAQMSEMLVAIADMKMRPTSWTWGEVGGWG